MPFIYSVFLFSSSHFIVFILFGMEISPLFYKTSFFSFTLILLTDCSFHLEQCPSAIYKDRETLPVKVFLGNLLGNLQFSMCHQTFFHCGAETALINSQFASVCDIILASMCRSKPDE